MVAIVLATTIILVPSPQVKPDRPISAYIRSHKLHYAQLATSLSIETRFPPQIQTPKMLDRNCQDTRKLLGGNQFDRPRFSTIPKL
ncbi:hypothetical protein [Chamaesiphon sp. OTE_75_metabat_556]|uniref:hypothetical protein n=1 Tax=Chamaesiphon sp. OTE_75_metabat_556 TaxID=2964692 RepID=UPI00286CB47D|nr:hypothetical protein [Chamaesiphon sp. OTE_75_metabat_556]